MKMIIADDHPMVRTGLAQIVAGLAENVTIIEAADFQETKAVLAEHPDADVALIDLNMPGMRGTTSIASLVTCALSVPLVVVSASENPHDVREVLAAGASGFVPKQEKAATLLSVLRLILAGGTYAPPEMVSAPVRTVSTGELTPRQREVLAMLANGCPNKEIARDLGVAEQTVKGHLMTIFRLINVSNRVQAAEVARRMGL